MEVVLNENVNKMTIIAKSKESNETISKLPEHNHFVIIQTGYSSN